MIAPNYYLKPENIKRMTRSIICKEWFMITEPEAERLALEKAENLYKPFHQRSLLLKKLQKEKYKYHQQKQIKVKNKMLIWGIRRTLSKLEGEIWKMHMQRISQRIGAQDEQNKWINNILWTITCARMKLDKIEDTGTVDREFLSRVIFDLLNGFHRWWRFRMRLA